jgi:hypothetical protein
MLPRVFSRCTSTTWQRKTNTAAGSKKGRDSIALAKQFSTSSSGKEEAAFQQFQQKRAKERLWDPQQIENLHNRLKTMETTFINFTHILRSHSKGAAIVGAVLIGGVYLFWDGILDHNVHQVAKAVADEESVAVVKDALDKLLKDPGANVCKYWRVSLMLLAVSFLLFLWHMFY